MLQRINQPMAWQAKVAPGICSTWLNDWEFILHYSSVENSLCYYSRGTKDWYEFYLRRGTVSVITAYIAFQLSIGRRCLNDPQQFQNGVSKELTAEEVLRKIKYWLAQKSIYVQHLINNTEKEEENADFSAPYYNQEKCQRRNKYERSVKQRKYSQKRVF